MSIRNERFALLNFLYHINGEAYEFRPIKDDLCADISWFYDELTCGILKTIDYLLNDKNFPFVQLYYDIGEFVCVSNKKIAALFLYPNYGVRKASYIELLRKYMHNEEMQTYGNVDYKAPRVKKLLLKLMGDEMSSEELDSLFAIFVRGYKYGEKEFDDILKLKTLNYTSNNLLGHIASIETEARYISSCYTKEIDKETIFFHGKYQAHLYWCWKYKNEYETPDENVCNNHLLFKDENVKGTIIDEIKPFIDMERYEDLEKIFNGVEIKVPILFKSYTKNLFQIFHRLWMMNPKSIINTKKQLCKWLTENFVAYNKQKNNQPFGININTAEKLIGDDSQFS